MDERTLRTFLIGRIAGRLQRMGIAPDEVRDDLDLLRSGVLDSLAFVDLVVALMDHSGREVDLEAAMAVKGGTTVGGILQLFQA